MQEKLNGTYYLFDCLIRQAMTREKVTEKDAKRIAMDHKATLYRYEYKDGEVKEIKKLYDPRQIFG